MEAKEEMYSKSEVLIVIYRFQRAFDKQQHTTQHCNGNVSVQKIFPTLQWAQDTLNGIKEARSSDIENNK